jgi:hypothetical protein
LIKKNLIFSLGTIVPLRWVIGQWFYLIKKKQKSEQYINSREGLMEKDWAKATVLTNLILILWFYAHMFPKCVLTNKHQP